jgi:hypothetical protein
MGHASRITSIIAAMASKATFGKNNGTKVMPRAKVAVIISPK